MSESEETPTNNGEKVCGVCSNGSIKYRCPRCEVLWCLLDRACSYKFYHSFVNNEIPLVYPNYESLFGNEQKKNDEEVEEILDKVEEWYDEEEIDSDERVKGLNPDYEEVEEILEKVEESYDEEKIDSNERVKGLNPDYEEVEEILEKVEELYDEEKIDSNKRVKGLNPYYEEVEEILEKVEESYDEEEIDSDKRVKGLNPNYANALMDAIMSVMDKESESSLNQRDVATFLPDWEPWWMYRGKNNLIQEVGKINDEMKALEKCPSLKKVPKFSDLTSDEPSPAIKNNITNVLASYVFIARYFMGDIDPIEGTTCLLSICRNLNSNGKFKNKFSAAESAAQQCLQNGFIKKDKESLNVIKRDTFLVLQGPTEDNSSYYCQAALSHLYTLFHLAMAQIKSQAEGNIKPKQKLKQNRSSKKFPNIKICDLPKPDVAKLKKCMKRVEFYLSYVGEYDLSLD